MPVAESGRVGQEIKTEVDLKAFHTADNLAVANVEINGLFTIRNVKIREGDYGLEVVMPRIKDWNQGRYKDACYFKSKEMREQFDRSVIQKYLQDMGLEEEETEYEEEYDDDEYVELEEEAEAEPEEAELTNMGMEAEEPAESEETMLLGSQEI
ncbi:septation protein SpoVG family protein [Hungatella hathewayi]|uniref:septation protein SpoVG family protein n=1 Tax=Hungatella hathewayi TaxID=154046 RepID=UPI003564B180